MLEMPEIREGVFYFLGIVISAGSFFYFRKGVCLMYEKNFETVVALVEWRLNRLEKELQFCEEEMNFAKNRVEEWRDKYDKFHKEMSELKKWLIRN